MSSPPETRSQSSAPTRKQVTPEPHRRRRRIRNPGAGTVSAIAQKFLDEGLAPPPNLEEKKRKIIKRKPGVVSVNYFTMDTQAAIVEFQAATTLEEKNKVFVARIFPAFSALVENLINVFGYHVQYESKEDLRNECVEFLYTVVGKFNVEKGSKAFSYFNVVAKNWLTVKSKGELKRQMAHVSLDMADSRGTSSSSGSGVTPLKGTVGFHELAEFEKQNQVLSPEDYLIAIQSEHRLQKIVKHLESLTKTEVEVEVMKAIGTLCTNLDDIDMLNKRAVLFYLRELTGFNSKQLSAALVALKRHYKVFRDQELNG